MKDTAYHSIAALTALKNTKRLTARQRADWAGHCSALKAANPGPVQQLVWGRPMGTPTTSEVLTFLGFVH